jgi:hypothetical protein
MTPTRTCHAPHTFCSHLCARCDRLMLARSAQVRARHTRSLDRLMRAR